MIRSRFGQQLWAQKTTVSNGTFPMTQYTLLQENEIQEISCKYDLQVIGYKPVELGASNSNYLLFTPGNQYILTIFEIEPMRVNIMCNVLSLLAEYGFPAPRIFKLTNGDTLSKYQEKPVLLKPYIKGQVPKDIDQNMLSQAGAAMARLHAIPIPDYLPDEHINLTKIYPRVLKRGNDQSYINWLANRIRILRQKINPRLPLGMIHGDLFYDNILFEGTKFKAMLDFEDVHRSYKVFDLGMTALGLCMEGAKVSLNKLRALVNGYQKARILEEIEKESLQTFIEYAAILTSTWRFWKYTIDAPDFKKSRKHMQMVIIAKNVRAIPKALFMHSVFS